MLLTPPYLRAPEACSTYNFGAEYMTRMVTMFNELNWIPYYNEAFINRCGTEYRIINENTETLRTNSDVHTRNTVI